MKKITLLLLIIPLLTIYSQQQVRIDWPSLANSPLPVQRGDMQNTGRSNFVGPRTFTVKWKKDMNLGIYSGPLIGYGDMLFNGEDNLSTIVNENYLYCTDKKSNSVWTFRTPGIGINDLPIHLTRDSLIIFSCGTTDSTYALKYDGTLKWKAPGRNLIRYQTAVDKAGNMYYSNVKDTIIVVSPNGQVIRKFKIPSYGVGMAFSTGGDTLFIICSDYQHYYALIACSLNGNIYWQKNFGYLKDLPVVDNQNNIYVAAKDTFNSSNFSIYRFKPDGVVNSKFTREGWFNGPSPVIDKNGNIIFLEVKNGTRVFLTKLDYSGNLLWSTSLSDSLLLDENYGGITVDAEGKCYFGGTAPGGYTYCIDADGSILWTYSHQYFEYDSSPAIGSDGTLYLGYHSNRTYDFGNLIAVSDNPDGIKGEPFEPSGYNLEQNYPNPFNPSTEIKYSIPTSSMVTLKVYNVLGKEIASLVNEEKPAGEYTVTFNGSSLSSGVYFYTLHSGAFAETKKFVLLK